MNEHERIVSPTVAPEHLDKIRAAQSQLVRFCDALRITICEEAVILYLTWLSEERESTGRGLKRTIAALDAARRLQGEHPWTQSEDVRRLMRGLLRRQPLGATSERAEPLYVELVALLVQATMRPTLAQQRDRAAIALYAATGLSATALMRLRWRDVRMRSAFVELTVLPPPKRQHWEPRAIRLGADGDPAPIAREIRRLRDISPAGTALLFGQSGSVWEVARVRRALEVLRAVRGDVSGAVDEVSRSPQQIRDRALLLIGYGAALRTREAMYLTQDDVRPDPRGLTLTIDGRRATTGVPHDPEQAIDPATAWREWVQVLSDQGMNHPTRPAFPAVSGSRIWDQRMAEARLNQIVQRACDRADLPGHYVFTSLRSGLIRTALRTNQQANDIAAHTDLRSLRAVVRHKRREQILSGSVAGQLGL